MGLGSVGKIDIRAISESMQPVTEAWFNATIEIINPKIGTGTFDRVTNRRTGRTQEVLWTGPARIQAMRWPNVATSRQEAVSSRTVVFHIPISEDVPPHFIQEGYRVHVLDGGMQPEFETGLYVITSTVNGSYAWDRRIECMMDQGAVIE